jgi:hypothetical protein
MMSMRSWKVSPAGIATAYRDVVDIVIADQQDEPTHMEGVQFAFTNTLMKSDADKTNLARFALETVHATREAAQ